MALFWHEIRRGRGALLCWGVGIGGLLAVCIFLYPQMAGQMAEMDTLFASLGGFSQAFGMDTVGIGSLTGFYAVECGTILSLGGGMFAALAAAGALAGEERGHTAEFLLCHPLPRLRLALAKLAALAAQLLALHLALYLLALGGVALSGETPPFKELTLLHTAALLCQLQLACLAFCLSAFARRSAGGAALGLTLGLYFLNLFANISEKAAVFSWLTPFALADGARVVADGALDPVRLAVGTACAALATAVGCLYFCKKDIYA